MIFGCSEAIPGHRSGVLVRVCPKLLNYPIRLFEPWLEYVFLLKLRLY